MIDPSTAYDYCETQYITENIKGGKISESFFQFGPSSKNEPNH